jgi:hypothetical protein
MTPVTSCVPIAAALVILLLLGIRNAWDMRMWMLLRTPNRERRRYLAATASTSTSASSRASAEMTRSVEAGLWSPNIRARTSR